MKNHLLISTLLAGLVILAAPSCSRVMEEDMPGRQGLPEGTPITMRLDFGYEDLMSVDVSTKAEASGADEERIHDLYVFIFCNGDEGEYHPHPGQKIYGRYFSYEHLQPDLATLDSSPNEGWYVENRTLDSVSEPISKTRGAVKISTRVCTSARIVVIANVDNGICKVGDQEDVLDYLNNIWSYDELEQAQVKLTQDIVNRKDLFLMLGVMENGSGEPKIDTGSMVWHTDAGSSSLENHSDTRYQVKLNPVDAKVKFKVRINDPDITRVKGEYISAAKAVYWQVCNAPDHCYLFSDYTPDGVPPGTAPEETVYFDTEPAYFEGTETDGSGEEWYVFSFYMLESRFAAVAHADEYHKREKQEKTNTDKTGYRGSDSEYYVENGEWIYAHPYAAYVKFDMILTLTPAGIAALEGSVTHALTSDTIYTVHLGDFSNSGLEYDDYNTYRSTCYTYEITIANAGTIYAEVKNDNERQPGQEGYLLLTDDEIVNADAHYEYHSITFTYDSETTPEKFSWYVKTPFTDKLGGGPIKRTKRVGIEDYPIYDPHAPDGTLLDYRWVKFKINAVEDGKYSTKRVAYPGDDAYKNHKDWGVGEHGPWDNTPHPDLMDISQLIQYIFEETKKENDTPGSSDFIDDGDGQKVIRATIFIDEYYYTVDPRDESADPQPNPNLWRQFVNAQPREMHILSRTVQSRDRKSDVIESSHSVIQQSIQTIYNIYAPGLRSLWGTEHKDEIKEEAPDGWPYWPDVYDEGIHNPGIAGQNNDRGKENGRLNTAYIWDLANVNGVETAAKSWETYMNFSVDNNVPELQDSKKGMAYSCLTRNRDNNGDGTIDRDEVRWYLASTRQLIGMWVGNESLSLSARLYQPTAGQWRSHIVSSTARLVCWSEEGGGATDLYHDWEGSNTAYATWDSVEDAAAGESVRCLRNIGTYDGASGVTDITYAPYTQEVDRYFTIETEGEGVNETTTFYFDRLNTKSIREYSEGELPYHPQTSLNNRVYVKMTAQSLSSQVDDFSPGIFSAKFNTDITANGTNPYCPEGWRLPNQVEYVLMSLYMPQSYFLQDATGTSYGSTVIMPSRTYYNRGKFGDLRQESGPGSSEKDKIGFCYSTSSKKVFCVGGIGSSDQRVKRTRCVKDVDQTGVISGKISVEGNVIYPGDKIPVDFKFFSNASALVSAELILWYTNSSGFRVSKDLTTQLIQPSGLHYQNTQDIAIPTLTELGLSQSDLSADMELEVVFRNLSNRSGSDILDVQMKNPLEGACTLIDATDDKIYPSDQNTINIVVQSHAHTLDISSVALTLSYAGHEPEIITIPAASGKTYNHNNQVITIPSLSELGLSASALTSGTTATLTATATAPGGLSKTFSHVVTLSNPVSGDFTSNESYSGERAPIYPDDNDGSINFNFHSAANVLNLGSASLKLAYTIPGGSATETVLSVDAQPSSKDYIPVQTLTIPAFSGLDGLTASNYEDVTDMRLVAIVAIDGDPSITATYELPVTLLSHLNEPAIDFPSSFTDNGVPVRSTMSLVSGHTASISNAVLQWKSGSGDWVSPGSATLSSLVSSDGVYYEDVYTKTIVGDDTFSAGSFVGNTSGDVNSDYSYRVVVTCSDGTSKTSPVRSMQLMKWNYETSLIDRKWTDTPDGLDFLRGDYIEAQIKMNKILLKSGLLSIGNNIDRYNNAEDVFHLYTGNTISKYSIRSSAFYHEYTSGGIITPHRFAGPGDVDHPDPEVNIRFDATGFFVDGKEGKSSEDGYLQWSKNNESYRGLVNFLAGQTSIEVGQEEGGNRSKSLYHYIRVIRER